MRAQAAQLQSAASKMLSDAAHLLTQAEILESGHPKNPVKVEQPGPLTATNHQLNATQPDNVGFTGRFDTSLPSNETPEQMGARRQREAMMKARRDEVRRAQTMQMDAEELKRE